MELDAVTQDFLADVSQYVESIRLATEAAQKFAEENMVAVLSVEALQRAIDGLEGRTVRIDVETTGLPEAVAAGPVAVTAQAPDAAGVAAASAEYRALAESELEAANAGVASREALESQRDLIAETAGVISIAAGRNYDLAASEVAQANAGLEAARSLSEQRYGAVSAMSAFELLTAGMATDSMAAMTNAGALTAVREGLAAYVAEAAAAAAASADLAAVQERLADTSRLQADALAYGIRAWSQDTNAARNITEALGVQVTAMDAAAQASASLARADAILAAADRVLGYEEGALAEGMALSATAMEMGMALKNEDAAATNKLAAAAASGATATGDAGNAANKAGVNFRLWGTGIALTGNAIHWLIGITAEYLAVAIPGTVALASGMAVAAEGGTWLADRMQAVYASTEATSQMLGITAGQAIGLKSALQQAQTAADPGVYEIFGSMVNDARASMYQFADVGLQVVHVLDEFSARVTLDLQGALGAQLHALLGGGVADLTEFGQVLGNLGHAILNLASDMPGLAEVLLKVIDGISRLILYITEVPRPIAMIVLGFEEFVRWGGLVVTLLGRLGVMVAGWGISLAGALPALGGFTRGLGDASVEMGAASEEMAALSFNWKSSLAFFATNPLGWVIDATVVLGVLAVALYKVKDSAEQMAGSMVAAVDAANFTSGLSKAITDLTVLDPRLKSVNQSLAEMPGPARAAANSLSILSDTGTMAGNLAGFIDKLGTETAGAAASTRNWTDVYLAGIPVIGNFAQGVTHLWASFTGAQKATTDSAALTGAQQKLVGAIAEVLGMNTKIGGSYYSLTEAMGLASAAGLTVGQAFNSQGKLTAIATQQIENLIQGYKSMGQQGTILAGDIDALNVQTLVEQTEVSKLNSAWDAFIQTVTGGTNALGSLNTELTTIGNVTQTATAKIAAFSQGNTGVDLSVKQVAAALKGFGGTSSQVWQNYDAAVQQAQQVTDWLRTAAAEGAVTSGQYSEAIKGVVGELLPYAAQSKTAQSELSALAYEATGTSMSYKQLTTWVGNTKTAQDGLNSVVETGTQKLSNLGAVAQNLSSTLNTAVDAAIANGAVNIRVITDDTQAFTQSLLHNSNQSSQTQGALKNLAGQLHDSGISAQDAGSIIYQLALKEGDSASQANSLRAEVIKMVAAMNTIKNENATVIVQGKGNWTVSGGLPGIGTPNPNAIIHPAAAGWRVPGYGGGDVHPAMLEGGEAVVPKHLVPQVAPILSAHGVPGFAAGGIVPSFSGPVGAGAGTLGGWATANFSATAYDVAAATAAATYKGMQQAQAAASAAAYGSAQAPASVAANVALGQKMAAAMGWTGAQFQDLYQLWMRESGWSSTALNKSSGAAGIAQSLGHGAVPMGNASAQIAWGLQYIMCMPLDAQILTRDGWKTHHDVQPGDETIGFDPASGVARWTRITAVHHYASAPFVRLHGRRFDVRVTPGHRWLTEKIIQPWPGKQYRRFEFTETAKLGTRHRLRLAAEHVDDGTCLPVSVAEAEIIGWIMGDGSINYGTNNRGGKRGKIDVRICQNKLAGVERLKSLLSDLPHSEYIYKAQPGAHRPMHTFRLRSLYARDLLARSGCEGDLDIMILSMSREQRDGFLRGMLDADGYRSQKKNGSFTWILAQNPGAVLDATVLAAFLCGHYAHVTDSAGQKRAHLTGAFIQARMRRDPCGDEAAWCVTTDLASWTAKESGQIFLTGNSRYGSPAAAWGHEISSGWYDKGGYLPQGLSLALNTTGRPEPVGGAGGPIDNHVHVYLDGKQIWSSVQRETLRYGTRNSGRPNGTMAPS